MDGYNAAFQIYNSFIATAVIYGLLLAVVLFFVFARKRGFPYIHLGLVSLCGIISQAVVVNPVITSADYGKTVPGVLYVYVIFSSIQYLIMFLIPVHVAFQQSKENANSKSKQSEARRLAYIGFFLAFIVISLLIIALIFIGSTDGTYSDYKKIYTFSSLYLAYAMLHWALILLWIVIALVLRKEISSIGTFTGFGFLLILMMVGITINAIGGGVQNATIVFTVFWAHLFLYHVCCFIAILVACYFGTIWTHANSVNSTEPSA
ncbi:hypothetical protein BJ944DRAFT_260863 [Cunninghamella echinulata]|nr:hypothetical protein BJ944DRAFT_260863 [Cunninghamella echinulata]